MNDDKSHPSEPEQEPATDEQELEESAVATEEGDKEKEPEKVDQTVNISEVGPCRKHVKVQIERTTIDGRLNEKYKELMEKAVVPGFRKGKAPRRVIERQFQRDVGQEIKGELLMASLQQLSEEFDIAPIAQPNLDPRKIDIPEKGPLIYEFEVEVRPEFELPDYKGMKIKRPVRDFTEEDVDREQKRLLADYGQLIPKDGPAEIDDFVIVDMTTKHEDKVIGQVKEVTLRVDNQLAFKDGVAEQFGEQVKGAKEGDVRSVDIKMSDNVSSAALAGQTVQATLEIKDVKSLRLPELTHEFLHTFGVHSVEELREEIMGALKRRLEYQQRQSFRQQILQHIEGESKLELPHDLLLRQARRTMNRRAMEMQDGGMTPDQIQARLRLMQQDILRNTAMSLKEHFVLQKIADQEKIEVDDAEIQAEINAIAEEEDENPRRVRARLEREGQLETLATLIVERKALDLILENAKYHDVPLEEDQDDSVALSEEQAVEGEMRDVSEEAERAAEEENAMRQVEDEQPAET